MNKCIIAVCLTVLLMLSLLPTAAATDTVSCLDIDSSLVIIGDSNTVALKNYNSDIRSARIYARVNASIVECVENYSRYHADGYDYGIFQLISNLDASSFRTVVINIGTNNVGTPTSSYQSNYRKLLWNLFNKNPNAVIYLCKILPVNPANCTGAYSEYYTKANVDRINDAVAELQQEFADQGYDARFMDLNTPFQNAAGVLKPEYDSGGGIHLTVSGYKQLNKVIQSALARGDENAKHSWDEGEILVPATCTAEGVLCRTCVYCGAEMIESIPTNGVHRWDDGTVSKEPSCTEPGVLHRTCLDCGAEEDTDIPALGHIWTFSELLTQGKTIHESTGRFICTRCGTTKKAKLCAKKVFTDMPAKSNWAHDAIDWAYFNGITGGTSPTTFSPNKDVTRAEAVTFLYAVKGKPEVNVSNPFLDVKKKDYFYRAVLWAVENTITSGTTKDSFSPKKTCSRAEIVMFLWAAAGRPAAENTKNPFQDVKRKSYYYQAVLWAAENGITGGIDPTHFDPDGNCTRAQLMVFLKAAYPILSAEADPIAPVDPGEANPA